jgi:tetratricopeptide (TPR) repeat protein
LELRPDYKHARNSLGLAYQGLKQWDRAIEAFRDELRHHPENFHSHVYLGFLYKEMKDDSQALIHFREALTCRDLTSGDEVREAIAVIEAAQKKREKGRSGG